MSKKYIHPALFMSALIGIASLGCAPDSISDVELPIPPASGSEEQDDDSLNSIAVNEVQNETSPAAAAFAMPNADAAADVVCRQFVELLNQEDSNNFELLLTPAALNIASRMNFHLPPIADPRAKFSVAQPAFGTIREKLCFVDCVFEETDADKNTTLTMMMRKTKSGWRIAGMMVDGETDGAKNLLSFENKKDVAQIKASVENVSVENEAN